MMMMMMEKKRPALPRGLASEAFLGPGDEELVFVEIPNVLAS
jgi:hypothetical protein